MNKFTLTKINNTFLKNLLEKPYFLNKYKEIKLLNLLERKIENEYDIENYVNEYLNF